MDSFSEMVQAVQDDLSSSDTSTFYTESLIKRALNRAYRRAGGLFLWPETEDAQKTGTVAGDEYYDYPSNWRPDTIFRLEVDGKNYGDPTTFKDYLDWKENNAGSTDKKWANQWRRYFIYPVPTTNGSNNIVIWGHKVVEKLVNNSDTTIFSYSYPECNDAVVLEAEEILKGKGDKVAEGQMASQKSLGILTTAFNKIRQAQNRQEKIYPFFDVPDLFGSSQSKYITGNFDVEI